MRSTFRSAENLVRLLFRNGFRSSPSTKGRRRIFGQNPVRPCLRQTIPLSQEFCEQAFRVPSELAIDPARLASAGGMAARSEMGPGPTELTLLAGGAWPTKLDPQAQAGDGPSGGTGCAAHRHRFKRIRKRNGRPSRDFDFDVGVSAGCFNLIDPSAVPDPIDEFEPGSIDRCAKW